MRKKWSKTKKRSSQLLLIQPTTNAKVLLNCKDNFLLFVWGPVVQWLVQRFRSERLRVRSRRSATFTPSAHVRRQSLPVWPPTLNNYLYLYLSYAWLMTDNGLEHRNVLKSNYYLVTGFVTINEIVYYQHQFNFF